MRIQCKEIHITQEFFSKKPEIDFEPLDERELYSQLDREQMCDFLRSEGYGVTLPREDAA
jgi:hypothetical protein